MALEVGLLEIFLPEAYMLLTTCASEAVGFQGVPGALDQMISEGQSLSDAALLGALVLPSILLRRQHIEALDQRPIKRSALRKLTTDAVERLADRFTLSRTKTERLQQAIWSFHRLGERWRSVASQVQFSRQPGFEDALALLEVLVRATGEGREKLDHWSRIREGRGESAPAQSRRRRRRRRRQTR